MGCKWRLGKMSEVGNRGRGSGGEERARLIGIAGCTNAGKTTISAFLRNEMMKKEGETSVSVICQDDFFRSIDEVKTIPKDGDPSVLFYDYDSPYAIDDVGFMAAIVKAAGENNLVIVEGNMISEFPEIFKMLDRVLFLTLPLDVCRGRRAARTDYDPPDTPGYFEQVVWPAYEEHYEHTVAMAKDDVRIIFLDGSKDAPSYESLKPSLLNFAEDVIRIQSEVIDTKSAIEFVSSSSCGATSVFIGTTRNTFNGKKVVRLDYECYEPMAYKELERLCARVRNEFRSIERISIYHRIGEVPVGEASVVIAASSPHRKEAIKAVEVAINDLKRNVPIWKKEVYGDGSCSWKENPESITDGNIQKATCCCSK